MAVRVDKQPDLPVDQRQILSRLSYQHSQPSKMSIGVAVESSAKENAICIMEDAGVLLDVISSNMGASRMGYMEAVQDKQEKTQVMVSNVSRQNEAPQRQTSPCVSTRSSGRKVSSNEANHQAKQSSCIPSNTDMVKQSSATEGAVKTHSIQFSKDHNSISQRENAKAKIFHRVAYQREGVNDDAIGRVWVLPSETAQEVLAPEKVLVDDGEDISELLDVKARNTGYMEGIQDKQEKKPVMVSNVSRQNEAPHWQTSPWVSARSSARKVSSTEAIHQEKQSSYLPSNTDMVKQSSATEGAGEMYYVQYSKDQNSILQRGDAKAKIFYRVAYQREGANDGAMGRVGVLPSETAQEVLAPEKELVNDGEKGRGNNGNEALRMKLWEILETFSSRNKEEFTVKVDANSSKPECRSDENSSSAAKHKQQLDTIEADSEKHDHIISRPLTQSLTRKKPQSKVSLKIQKSANSYKQKQLDPLKYHFSFVEGCAHRLDAPVGGTSSLSKSKEGKIKSSRIMSCKRCFPKLSNADDTQQPTNRRKVKIPAKKSLFPGNRGGSFNGSASQEDNQTVETKNGMQEKDSHHSPVVDVKDQPGDIDNSGPMPQEKRDHEDPLGNHSLKNNENPQYCLQNPILKRKESEIKSSETKFHKACFPTLSNLDETQQPTDTRKVKDPAKKSLFPGKRIGSSDGSSFKKDNETAEIKNRMQGEDSHHPPVVGGTDQRGDIDISEAMLQELDHRDPIGNHSSKNREDPQHRLQSPTFEVKRPSQSSSPSSLSSNQGKRDADTSVKSAFDMERFCWFKSSLISDRGHHQLKPNIGSSVSLHYAANLDGELEDSPVIKSTLITGRNFEEDRRSIPACEGLDSESSEDRTPIRVPIMKEGYKEDRRSISTCKGMSSSEDSEDNSPVKGSEDNEQHSGSSEQDGEEGLASAVTLFALILGRVKSKINSCSTRKADEIMMAVSENIHLQKQNVESEIQTEMENLISISKSKRRHLEDKLQEEKEQLKLICDRFKEDVNQHVRTCRSIHEELVSHREEFEQMAQKKRLLHRKLLQQTDEKIQSQLNDAEGRLKRVHKLATQNLSQLKYAIAECLEDMESTDDMGD